MRVCRGRKPSPDAFQKALLTIGKKDDVVNCGDSSGKVVFHNQMQVSKKPVPIIVILRINDGKGDGKQLSSRIGSGSCEQNTTVLRCEMGTVESGDGFAMDKPVNRCLMR